MSPGFEAGAEPEQWREGRGDQGSRNLPYCVEESFPQEAEDHEDIRARRKRGAFSLARRGGEKSREDGELGVAGRAGMAQVFPGGSWIDAAQGFAGCVGEPGRIVPFLSEQLHKPVAPEGTTWDQMLRQYPLGIGPSRGARRRAEYRRDADTSPLSVASDGPSPRVGMENKLVMFPAQRTAQKSYGGSNVGNEVLKCFDLCRYATLFSLVAWVAENPSKACGRPRSFPATPGTWLEAGKLPWRTMVCHSDTFGKNQEKPTGEKQGWLTVVFPTPASRHAACRQLTFREALKVKRGGADTLAKGGSQAWQVCPLAESLLGRQQYNCLGQPP